MINLLRAIRSFQDALARRCQDIWSRIALTVQLVLATGFLFVVGGYALYYLCHGFWPGAVMFLAIVCYLYLPTLNHQELNHD